MERVVIRMKRLLLMPLLVAFCAFAQFTPSHFDPRSVAGLQVMLVADPAYLFTDTGCTTNVVNDGDLVKCWKDISGHRYDATEGTDPPVYHVGGGNGLPYVQFNGTSQTLTLVAGASGVVRNVSGATVYMVFANASSSLVTAFTASGATATVTRLAMQQRVSATLSNGNMTVRRLDTDTPTSALAIPATTIVSGAWTEVTYRQDWSAGTGTIFRNGASVVGPATTSSTGTSEDAASSRIKIGSSVTATNFYNGKVAVLMLFGVASATADRQRVERYLCRRYALTCS